MARKRREYRTSTGVVVRSGLELRVAEKLEELGVEWEYESERCQFTWRDYNPRGACEQCGQGARVYQERQYLADFCVGGSSIVEVKGRLTQRDRRLLKAIRTQHPDIDLLLVFDKDNRIHKGAKTRYSEWAERTGFDYALKGRVEELFETVQ